LADLIGVASPTRTLPVAAVTETNTVLNDKAVPDAWQLRTPTKMWGLTEKETGGLGGPPA